MIAVDDLSKVIQENLDDASLSGRIIPTLNVAQNYLANKFDLPALDTSGDLTTTVLDYAVDLPTDYMKNVWHVASASSSERVGGPQRGNNNPYYDLHRFLKKWPLPSITNAGSICDCAIKGRELWYQEVAIDTLTIHYYKNPVTLVAGADVVSLPAHLVQDLLENFVCWKLYGIIEDGVEGKKIDTAYYKGLYDIAEAQLESFIPKRGEPMYVTDDADSIYNY
jgi:hypothetical protein